MFGHTQEDCRKKNNQSMEWRAKPHEHVDIQQQTIDGESDGMDGLQQVTTGQHRAKPATQRNNLAPTIETLMANSFNALLEAEVDQEMGRGGGQNPNG